MYVRRLVLDEFRSYQRLELDIPQQGLRLVGDNASGKTSVLEALVMLSTGRSPRASQDRDVISWTSGVDYGVPPYARWESEVAQSSGLRTVGLSIELATEGARLQRKQFFLDGERVRAVDHVGVLKSILFSPEDVMLVSGTPSERRRQLDILLSQLDRTYLRQLSMYTNVLAQRNHLLKQFQREKRNWQDSTAVTEISFWDEQLVESGAYVLSVRAEIAAAISARVGARSADLIIGRTVGYRYAPRLEGLDLARQPNRQDVAGVFRDVIEATRQDEFRRGMTLSGPHRDDLVFTIDERELAQFGSRGQQRLGVIAYRLAEIDVIDSRSPERPILLLDDVLSELDDVHRGMLVRTVTECGCQLLITSTQVESLQFPEMAEIPIGLVDPAGIVIE